MFRGVDKWYDLTGLTYPSPFKSVTAKAFPYLQKLHGADKYFIFPVPDTNPTFKILIRSVNMDV